MTYSLHEHVAHPWCVLNQLPDPFDPHNPPKKIGSQPPQSTRPKVKTLEEKLAEFQSIDRVVFDPIELEQHCVRRPTPPATGLSSNLLPI